MSPELLAAIHEVYGAMNRRDLVALRALGERFPEYQWRNAPDMPQTALRDRESGLAYVEEEVFGSFDRNHTEIEQVVDLGPEAAAFLVHHTVRGAASGAEATRREVHLWRARGDALVGMEEFLTLDEARAAAG